MRFGFDQNFLRRAEFPEAGKHIVAQRIPHAGDQFPVRKGAGAPGAELNIGLRIQNPVQPKPLGGGASCRHVVAPVHDYGAIPVFRQHQCGKKPRGTHPHNQRARRKRLGAVYNLRCLLRKNADTKARKARGVNRNRFLPRCQHGANLPDIGFSPCVKRLFIKAKMKPRGAVARVLHFLSRYSDYLSVWCVKRGADPRQEKRGRTAHSVTVRMISGVPTNVSPSGRINPS